MAILYLSTPERGAIFRAQLAEAFPGLPFHEGYAPDPAAVTVLIAWTCPPETFTAHPNLALLISIGAGVDQLDLSAVPGHVTVVRMLEPGLPEQMAEWVTMAVLALHRDLPTYIAQGREGLWKSGRNVPARARRIGVMGMGQLGLAVLSALKPFGFPLAGFSRRGTAPEGVEGFTDLDAFLARTDLLIGLLPLTADTEGLFDAQFFAKMPRGARFVQAGRGKQLNTTDLLAALDSGQLSAAMLDVTDPEPLPSDHPLWRHPGVIITPHVACQTRAEEGARHVVAVLRAWQAKAPIPGLIDRARGY
ncbi:MAG: glyoxylate/hydroxypyruvate reductase A [Beijerinckiaceae bacterium]|jgi:glyoxylate/hydroxypyruvate reductase A|nr:glyoxylate/hydroxypyruvate reductase A [Beijerinckiaceae bacterium]